ncbi:hypothetical protein JIN85_14730 [Luteolibacter pohnpeiensis]|uniref:Uncharacterized protein n=1 Tax=Luteolibacter pohnpeiensis TaxID=454153 RepID=A0A934VVL2_9BACT|nr:hypothetical protein [Luteolibacter pohnpeiensis]MBK1883672.1 hypothetical protein [Luteolibacter pohnpeiensis]
MKWNVTAKGWVCLCPVWLADPDSEAPVPIPRPLWLGWWLSLQFWGQDVVNFILVNLIEDFEPGYAIHHVESVDSFIIEV